MLLPNGPEYLFWLNGAALAGAAVVGINPTRRGEALAADVRATDCQLIVTDADGARLLEGLDLGLAPERVLVVGTADYEEAVSSLEGTPKAEALIERADDVPEDQLYLLLFTSGTTGAPKAVRCTQGRLAGIAEVAAPGYGYSADSVCYCPMPLFHGNALMALWGPAVMVGATIAVRPRFSASAFLDDVRRFGATTFSYVGKAIAYILATPERPDDADNTLVSAFGTEASLRDRARFHKRFGCYLIEGYGQSEGGAAINPVRGMPPGALGLAVAGADLAVVDPVSSRECPAALLDAEGRLLNAGEAIGEIVNRSGRGKFEGYYGAPEAEGERTRGGWYWTGDLAYRDEQGYFYFAGRRGRLAAGRLGELRRRPRRDRPVEVSRHLGVRGLRGARHPLGRPGHGGGGAGPRGRASTPRTSPPGWPASPTSGPNGPRATCGSPPRCRRRRPAR